MQKALPQRGQHDDKAPTRASVRHARRRLDREGRPKPGLRRVDWVRILVDGDELRAEATGVGFRLPVTTPIPLAVAGELIAAGTPYIVRRQDQG
jgi:hypothetical protein